MNALSTGALVVLAVLGLVWTLSLLPVLLEVRRASVRLQEFIRTLELDLRPFLQEGREVLHNVHQTAQNMADNTAKVGRVAGSLQEASENIRMATGVVRAIFGSRLLPVAGLMAGVRAGIRMLWRSSRGRKTS